jgi:hypothetical protein
MLDVSESVFFHHRVISQSINPSISNGNHPQNVLPQPVEDGATMLITGKLTCRAREPRDYFLKALNGNVLIADAL